jgi:cation diffusion facilitator family transporter
VPEPAARLVKWAWLSIAAALATIGLKTAAYLVTGSVGLLSDALESMVNLVAAIVALIALTVAARPPDRSHHFGHGKAEYFSAGAEGVMIVVAALLIIVSAVERLIHPRPLEDLGIGLGITLVATAINAVVGILLIRVGRSHRSITLVADGKHLMTDVWTSVGVVAGVALVGLTGWLPLDSLVAIGVAINILWTGYGLMVRATRGLMDHALPDQQKQQIVLCLRDIAAEHPPGQVQFHAIQTREAGRQRFTSLHVLVPGAWTVAQAHDLVEQVEDRLGAVVEDMEVHAHVEPIDDPRSYEASRPGLALDE